MQEILGGYTAVTLRDGSEGNYDIAQQYYRDFHRLEVEKPAAFNKFCTRVLTNPQIGLTEEHKAILVDAGLAWRSKDSTGTQLARPEEEIKKFVQLAVQEKTLSRIFSFFSSRDDVAYKLVSPFKKPEAGLPDEVARQNRTPVIMDWAGHDTKDCPAYKLFP